MKLRTGRKVGRTLYRQLGLEPSDDDPVVGLVDTAWLAEEICKAINYWDQWDDDDDVATAIDKLAEVVARDQRSEGEGREDG